MQRIATHCNTLQHTRKSDRYARSPLHRCNRSKGIATIGETPTVFSETYNTPTLFGETYNTRFPLHQCNRCKGITTVGETPTIFSETYSTPTLFGGTYSTRSPQHRCNRCKGIATVGESPRTFSWPKKRLQYSKRPTIWFWCMLKHSVTRLQYITNNKSTKKRVLQHKHKHWHEHKQRTLLNKRPVKETVKKCTVLFFFSKKQEEH